MMFLSIEYSEYLINTFFADNERFLSKVVQLDKGTKNEKAFYALTNFCLNEKQKVFAVKEKVRVGRNALRPISIYE